MLVRNLNFSSGLVHGQKCVLHAISPNSRVIQAELLTEEEPHPVVSIPRINCTTTVGKRGISFSRIQFPLRTAYAMTINKSQHIISHWARLTFFCVCAWSTLCGFQPCPKHNLYNVSSASFATVSYTHLTLPTILLV